MNIAVNTRLLIKNKLEGIGWFTYETLKYITTNHPEHTFYFIFDRSFDKEFIFSDNVVPLITGPQARHPFLFYYWFEKSIPKILKKINADIFVSPDGFLSLNTNVKSIAVIHDINFMHHPEWLPFLVRKYYQMFFPKFAKKAKRIATVSDYSKNDIIKIFDVDKDGVDVVYNGSKSIYKPITEEEKRITKEKYTQGHDYFLFVGALSPRKNVANLITAFNLLKEKTKGNVKLVIVGEKMFKTKEIKDSYLKTIHKEDIVFTGRLNPEELRNLYGASIALTYTPFFEGFGIPLVEAMNCETAILTSNVTSMPEVAGEAALYAEPSNITGISNKMIQLYKDKELRSYLIEKGRVQREKFSWEKTAQSFWNNIEKVLYE